MGSIYVPVDASVANNGIMTLDASGGGQTGGGYWINWDVSGFIGKGWFWDDPNNHLSTGWENAVTAAAVMLARVVLGMALKSHIQPVGKVFLFMFKMDIQKIWMLFLLLGMMIQNWIS